jgi:hypothetical protein
VTPESTFDNGGSGLGYDGNWSFLREDALDCRFTAE